MLIFNEHVGLLNYVLKDLDIINSNVAWLGKRKTVFMSVVVAELWRGTPFFTITMLGALKMIPIEIYESCKIDGAGSVRTFVSITLPFLKETIIYVSLLRAIWEFNNIDLIYNLTGGGPMGLTMTLNLYMYRTAILNTNYGYGSAIAVIGFVLLLVFALIYLRIGQYGRSISE
jgi:multiple sugar transport system permease protein